MLLKDAIERIDGLKYIADSLEILSAPGRNALMALEFLTDIPSLQRGFDILQTAIETSQSPSCQRDMERIRLLLMQLRDIRGTIKRLEEGKPLDDIDFFELKGLALLACELRNAVAATPLASTEAADFPALEEAAQILDPETTGSRHFYIYDSYSPELAEKRSELRLLQAQPDYDEILSEKLTGKCFELEDKIRRELSAKLRPLAPRMMRALNMAGKLDLLIARARQSVSLRLTRPEFGNKITVFSLLRYPPVEEKLKTLGMNFQPVSLKLLPGVTLVTGANMGGKTITLKSVALAQAMAQLGFYVAAEKANMIPVEEIFLSWGDRQSELSGLSSFGAEIMEIDRILTALETSQRCLVLIDEPARTTNPEEGRAMVGAIVEILENTGAISVVTTHYSGIHTTGRRLRVKGIREDIPETATLSPSRISEYMDYSLVEDSDSDVPREALRIASLLGIGRKFAHTIRKNIEKQQ